MTPAQTYPFVPKSTAKLIAGQFWGIPLRDGRWASGRVVGTDSHTGPGSRTMFVGGLMDWIGDSPPTNEMLAASRLLEVGNTHLRAITTNGGEILGYVPLSAADAAVAGKPARRYWGDRYIARAAERLAELGPERYRQIDEERAQAGLFPEIRQLRSPLKRKMLKPLEDRIEVVQFDEPLADSELKRVARFMEAYPDVRLRMYGHGNRPDLEWLRYFPGHQNFMVDAYNLESLDGLRHLPETLTRLAIGQTKRVLSLGPLQRFARLEVLYLEGHTKDIEVVSQLRLLEDVTLRSITLPDLSVLLPLERLWSLDLKLGGTTNLDLLPKIGSLKYLELWMIRGLDDLSPVSDLTNLRFLFLQALRRVTALPDLSRCTRLRRTHLETMKGLTDLSPLADAPALEQLLLVDMPHLRPEHLEPLRHHPTLTSMRIGLGSAKRNQAAEELLNLPDVELPPADLYD